MIKIENVVLPSPEQWEAIIRGIRNAYDSWDLSDSYTTYIEDPQTLERSSYQFFVGDADNKLMLNLAKAGTDHGKYLRMAPVIVDITAPLYWWKEFDTYRVGVAPNPTDIEINSCSTMHTVHKREFTADDFSHELLINVTKPTAELIEHDCVPFEESGRGDTLYWTSTNVLDLTIEALNKYRQHYLETKDRKYWDQLIQLLPSSYNQRRTMSINYAALANMYHARKNHKLAEWHTLCDWIETLPHSDLIIGG